MKCERCNGTGYQTAAREMGMEDYPMMQRPLGVWKCEACGGTGEQYNPREMLDKFKQEHPEEYEQAMKEFREKLEAIKKSKKYVDYSFNGMV